MCVSVSQSVKNLLHRLEADDVTSKRLDGVAGDLARRHAARHELACARARLYSVRLRPAPDACETNNTIINTVLEEVLKNFVPQNFLDRLRGTRLTTTTFL